MVLVGKIKFDDKPIGIYYAGQTVSGIFELKVDELTQIKSIRVNVRGFSKCEWSRWDGIKIMHYEDHEYYFDSNSVLLSSADEPVCIPIGTHSYPFSCDLTRTVPSSFEGKYGHIRYQVTAIVEHPLRPNYTCCTNFSVINQYDLNNTDSSLQCPIESEKLEYFCCPDYTKDPLKIRINLPQTAFVPGESIPIEVNVANNTNNRVNLLNLYLIKTITYYTFVSMQGVKKERSQISKQSLEGIPPFASKQFHTNFIICHGTPSNLGLCRLITIDYKITAKIIAPILNVDVEIISIVIGNNVYNTSVPYNTTQAITTQPTSQAMSQPYPIGFVNPYQQNRLQNRILMIMQNLLLHHLLTKKLFADTRM